MPYIVVKEIETNYSPFLGGQSFTIKLEAGDLDNLSNYFTDIWNPTEEELTMYCLENNVDRGDIELLTSLLKLQKKGDWIKI